MKRWLVLVILLLSSLTVHAEDNCNADEECIGGKCSSIITDIRIILNDEMMSRIQKISALAAVLRDYFLSENTCATPAQITANCVSLLNNGNPEQKIDVVFVGDEYSSLELWREDVQKFADLNGNQHGFFYSEPMKSMKDKFNGWYIDELKNIPGCYDTFGEVGPDCKQTALQLAQSCGGSEIVLIIRGIQNNNPGMPLSWPYGTIPAMAITERTRGGDHYLATAGLVHEFGHAFAGLSDEYQNFRATDDFSNRPNADREGCPKWCSGNLNTEAECYADYLQMKECITLIQTYPAGQDQEVYDCLRTRGLYESPNPEVNPDAIAECDLGTGCQAGTGCYWNAKSIISFRSSVNSVMKYPEEVGVYAPFDESFQFNVISQEAIRDKINQLSPE